MNVSPHHQRPTKYPWPGLASRIALILAVVVILVLAYVLIADPFRNQGADPDQSAAAAVTVSIDTLT